MLNIAKLAEIANTQERIISGVVHVPAGCNADEETRNLVGFTRDKIMSGTRAAFTEWLNANLTDMDTFGDETIILIKYRTERGDIEQKAQYLAHTLWSVCLTALATDRDNWLSTNIVERSIKNWLETDKPRLYMEKAGFSMTDDEIKTTAMRMVRSLQDKGVLCTKIAKRNELVIDSDGNTVMENGKPKFFTARFYPLTSEFQLLIDNITEELCVEASMTCRPMTNKPNDWTSPKDGIGKHARIRLIKAKFQPRSVSRPVLDAVNKLQSVQFMVSPVIVRAAKEMKRCNNALTKELSGYFSDKELVNEAFDAYAMLGELAGGKFYFPVTMDSRGRMYYRGGLLTPQGTDFCKAAFQFAEGKPLGDRGLQAIYVHTAGVFGMDKVSIKDRIEWVTKNLHHIVRCESHWNVRKNFKGADVFQALVAAAELRSIEEWKAAGKPVKDFVSHLVCHQDGTCNGLQHSAAITGDRATAEAVNCVASTASDVPADVYDLVAKQAEMDSDGDVASLIAKYGRGMAKNPVMITSYGAGEETIIRNTGAYLSKAKNEGADHLGEEVGKAYCEAIGKVAGGVTALTEEIKMAVKETIKQRLVEVDGDHNKVNPSIKWKTADGFIASTEYRQEELFRVRQGAHAIRVRGRGKAPIDTVKTECAMSPNLIHSIDAAHLRMIVNGCDHDLVTVHDSIGSHAADFYDTARVIREQFVAVHAYDALANLCDNLGQPTPEFDGDYRATEALQSTYIFS
jgi:hypothetical protein